MLASLGAVLLVGMGLGWCCRRVGLPALLGMLFTGILLGPYGLDWLAPSLLNISGELRQLALIVILARAGLGLSVGELRGVGRPALLMCFLPACLEMGGVVLLAPRLLGFTVLEAAILGAVVAAVSPAVVVPRMLDLAEGRWGTDKGIPQMIMAAASVDDVFVIVFFTAFVGLAGGEAVSPRQLAGIPVAIALGLGTGLLAGMLLCAWFRRFSMRDTAKVLVVLGAAFLLVELETRLQGMLPLSGLLAVMGMGATLRWKRTAVAQRLSARFSRVWVAAEVLLFVLVGAAVDIRYALAAGLPVLALLAGALIFRMMGVALCQLGGRLNWRERLFCMIAYCPKATVQAAIGSLPLSMGLSCGAMVLTVAVMAILVTAALGALAIDRSYRTLLSQGDEEEISPQ